MPEISPTPDEVAYWLISGGCENGSCVVDVTYFMPTLTCRKIPKSALVTSFAPPSVTVTANGANIRTRAAMSVVGRLYVASFGVG